VTDRSINLGCVVAYMLWAAVVLLLGLGLILDNAHVGQVGLAAAAAAATATIRSYFVRSNQIMRNSIALRGEGGVRSVR
jgi:predicted membrane-bound spermidine synthase